MLEWTSPTDVNSTQRRACRRAVRIVFWTAQPVQFPAPLGLRVPCGVRSRYVERVGAKHETTDACKMVAKCRESAGEERTERRSAVRALSGGAAEVGIDLALVTACSAKEYSRPSEKTSAHVQRHPQLS